MVRRVTDNDPIMAIDVSRSGSDAVVRLAGELDPHSADALADALDGLAPGEGGAGGGLERVVLDLSGIEFIDSSGLRVVLAARERLAAEGAALVLRAPSEAVHRLLEITDLLDRLDIE